MLQFITDNNSATPVVDQVNAALDAGCRWILLDTTGKDTEEMRTIVEAIMHRCMETEAFLLIDNDVDMAKELNVGGVNLHKGGTPPSQARVKLGAAAIVGVETDSYDDIAMMKSLDIDYFAIGPYPEVDADSITKIVESMRSGEVEIASVAFARNASADECRRLEATGVNAVCTGSLDAIKELCGK